MEGVQGVVAWWFEERGVWRVRVMALRWVVCFRGGRVVGEGGGGWGRGGVEREAVWGGGGLDREELGEGGVCSR